MEKWLHESLVGWKEIRTLCLENYQKRSYIKYLNQYATYYGKWINYWTMRNLIIPKIQSTLFMQLGIYFFGGIFIMDGSLSIGDLLVFSLYYERFFNSIKFISGCNADLCANMPYTDRLIYILDKIDKNRID